MNIRYLFVAALMIAVMLPASAQRRTKTAKKKSKGKVENAMTEQEMRRQQYYDITSGTSGNAAMRKSPQFSRNRCTVKFLQT